MPFFWTQESGRISVHRSLESSVDAFIKHSESLIKDYEGKSVLMVNLLCKSIKDEEQLTQGLLKLREDTHQHFDAQGKQIDYEYFDFHYNCKKGTGLLDQYVNDMLKQQYLRDIGVFLQKHSVYKHNNQL